jgi:TetR/AcrR family transcriptional regulator, regulator of autoinduction and epiphytic fitness
MLGLLALYMQELSAPADGRTARALRTRNAVVDALLDLIEEGHLRPPAALVAQRAGVSLRSVYQHFDDVETLFRVAAERHQQRLADLEPLPPLPADTAGRIAAFVAHQARRLEAISPMARAAALQEPFSEGVAARMAAGRARHRRMVADTFAPELALAADREALLHALDVATSWPAWEGLRRGSGLAVGQAAAVVELTLSKLLQP